MPSTIRHLDGHWFEAPCHICCAVLLFEAEEEVPLWTDEAGNDAVLCARCHWLLEHEVEES